MNRDKQIDEMARICCNVCKNGICILDDKPCNLECTDMGTATRLYDAGYRKSTDLAREIFEEIESARVKLVTDALQCIRTYKSPAADPFYTLCEGKLTGFDEMRHVLAELKKKYTQERDDETDGNH